MNVVKIMNDVVGITSCDDIKDSKKVNTHTGINKDDQFTNMINDFKKVGYPYCLLDDLEKDIKESKDKTIINEFINDVLEFTTNDNILKVANIYKDKFNVINDDGLDNLWTIMVRKLSRKGYDKSSLRTKNTEYKSSTNKMEFVEAFIKELRGMLDEEDIEINKLGMGFYDDFNTIKEALNKKETDKGVKEGLNSNDIKSHEDMFKDALATMIPTLIKSYMEEHHTTELSAKKEGTLLRSNKVTTG